MVTKKEAPSVNNVDENRKRLSGPVLMLMAVVIFSILWTLVRYTSETVHPFVIVFYRSLFGVLVLLGFFSFKGFHLLKTRRPSAHLLRGFSSLGATLCIFYGIANAPLGDVVAISFSAKIIATVGAVIVLREVIRMRRIVATIVGFIGVLIVLRPGFQELSPGILAAAVGSVFLAMNILIVKSLSGSDNPQAIVFYTLLFILPASGILAAMHWTWPTWQEFFLLVSIGVLVTVAHTLMTKAFAMADVTALLPLDFIRLVLTSLFGLVFFAEPLNIFTWIGAAIILASTVYTAHREMQLKKKASIEPVG